MKDKIINALLAIYKPICIVLMVPIILLGLLVASPYITIEELKELATD